MFGTIARYRLKSDQEARFMEEMKGFESNPPEGWVSTTLYRSTNNPNEVWMSVVFESEEAYRRNADSPDMDRQYQQMLEHLESEPEWHDGHVIHHETRETSRA